MTIEFCLPIFNEEKILRYNVLRLIEYMQKQNFSFNWKIILLINGSNDNSYEIGQNLSHEHLKIIGCFNYPEAGRGKTLKRYYLTSPADILVYMDSDLAVSLDNIPDLINPLISDQADLVTGSRLLPESKIKRSFIRELSSQSYNFLSKIILGHKFSDLQCGFKAIRAPVFKAIAPYIKDEKWFFDTEIIAFSHYHGWRIKEIPVDWSENRWDERKSKVNVLHDSCKFIYNLIKLKIRLLKTTKHIKHNT